MMNTNQTQTSAVSAIFQEAYIRDNDIYVKVDAKTHNGYVRAVAKNSDVRRTKRFNPQHTADRALFKFVRQDLHLKGKHVHIHVITPTSKEDTFRDQTGKLVKLNDDFKLIDVAANANAAKPVITTEPVVADTATSPTVVSA